MTPPERIKLIITIAAIILLLSSGVFIGRCTKKDNRIELELTKQLMSAKDSINRMLERERGYYISEIEVREKLNDELQEKDSILTAKYSSDQKIYKQLNDKLESIKSTLGRVANNNDSLRAIASSIE